MATKKFLCVCHPDVNKVTDILKEGDEVLVKVLEVDSNGRISLSRKAALEESPDNVS